MANPTGECVLVSSLARPPARTCPPAHSCVAVLPSPSQPPWPPLRARYNHVRACADLVKVRLQAEGKLAPGVPKRYSGAMNAYATIIKQVRAQIAESRHKADAS